MTSNIPAEARGLGSCTAEYTPSAGRPRQVMIVTAMLVFFGVSCIALSVSAAISRSDNGMLLVSAFGLVFIGVGVWWYVNNRRQRDLRVLVFPEGLSYTNRGRTEIIRWDDVKAAWQDITEDTDTGTIIHVYTVDCNDGRKYVFKDTLVDVEELGNAIQRESARRMLPRVLEAYDAGQTIPFGKLSISQAGITQGKETLPWEQVKRVRPSHGLITIEEQGKRLKWASVRALEVPNILVFLTVVNQVVGVNKEG
jgi:hypothetical protein